MGFYIYTHDPGAGRFRKHYHLHIGKQYRGESLQPSCQVKELGSQHSQAGSRAQASARLGLLPVRMFIMSLLASAK